MMHTSISSICVTLFVLRRLPVQSSKVQFHHLTNHKKHWCVKDAQNSSCEMQNQAEGPNMVGMQMVLSKCRWVRNTSDLLLLLLHRQRFCAGCLSRRALGAALRRVWEAKFKEGTLKSPIVNSGVFGERQLNGAMPQSRSELSSHLRWAFRGNHYFHFHFRMNPKWL